LQEFFSIFLRFVQYAQSLFQDFSVFEFLCILPIDFLPGVCYTGIRGPTFEEGAAKMYKNTFLINNYALNIFL